MNNITFQALCRQLENQTVVIKFKHYEDLIGKVTKTSEGYLIQKDDCLINLDYTQVKDVQPLR